MKNDNLKAILIDIRDNNDLSDSFNYENEMNNFIEIHEGDNIVNDIQLLREMGYDNRMINKIYILLRPDNIERAIDLMTQENGIYQHEFFENHNKEKDKGLCFICKKPKRFHINYIPENDMDIENDNFDKEEKNNIDLNVSNNGENICSVCFEEIGKEEKQFNHLSCGHVCCTQCWINYFKALILEAKVEQIKCVEHKCTTIIPEYFIMSHIQKDTKLVDKYYKFKKRAEIINDPNKKICPRPYCDSYLEKSNITKYVKCENGHEYCFECLNRPHGNILCDKYIEEEFMDWKKDKRVKRCPRCKIYTEKNEGCNHMTCTSCKYQWCWLCEGEYKYGHYDSGKCRGFQFTKADNLEEAEKVGRDSLLDDDDDYLNLFEEDLPEINCCFTLYTFFPCFFEDNRHINLLKKNLWIGKRIKELKDVQDVKYIQKKMKDAII